MINASLGAKQLRSEVPPPPWAGTLWESCKDEREKGGRRLARQREVDALWESEKRWWRELKEMTTALAADYGRGTPFNLPLPSLPHTLRSSSSSAPSLVWPRRSVVRVELRRLNPAGGSEEETTIPSSEEPPSACFAPLVAAAAAERR